MFTIETLEELTGYSKNTLYSLTSDLNIKPYKNRIAGIPSKGVYDNRALEAILYYKELTQEKQLKKKEALVEVVNAEILQR